MMELKDTIEGMTSADYKERFKAEYNQVSIRFNKLLSMIMKYHNGELDFKPNCDIELLKSQIRAMDTYRAILKYRARIEGINLD